MDVPCPVCNALAGKRCRYTKIKHGQLMVGSHNRRVWDAQAAQEAMNALLSD